MGRIEIARVYDADAAPPGRRYLVDRVWPRGISKDSLAPDGWVKDAAPSDELRRWFGHDPARWAEFRERYVAELDARPETWRPLLEAAEAGPITLLYGARDRDHNNAVVLRGYLMERLAEESPDAPSHA